MQDNAPGCAVLVTKKSERTGRSAQAPVALPPVASTDQGQQPRSQQVQMLQRSRSVSRHTVSEVVSPTVRLRALTKNRHTEHLLLSNGKTPKARCSRRVPGFAADSGRRAAWLGEPARMGQSESSHVHVRISVSKPAGLSGARVSVHSYANGAPILEIYIRTSSGSSQA